jgi:hypothetical protein
LATLAEPPTPPSGNVYDSFVDCTTNSVLVYGSFNGDINSVECVAQKISSSTENITAFGIQIERHGTPSHPLVIGIVRGETPPENPFDTTTWESVGSILPSYLPSQDTFYWFHIEQQITNVITSPAWLIAITNADFNANAYWAWATCDNVPTGQSSMNIFGVI